MEAAGGKLAYSQHVPGPLPDGDAVGPLIVVIDGALGRADEGLRRRRQHGTRETSSQLLKTRQRRKRDTTGRSHKFTAAHAGRAH